jgi:aldehyde dehydrogenase (NAD+)
MMKMAELILGRAEELAEAEARDTGKPMGQARADIGLTARYFEYYGGAADKLHGQIVPFMGGFNAQVTREPYGVTAHILPWNYPAQMFGRSLAPALATGNAVVLKPAEEACMTPLLLSAIAEKAGFPPGSINVVTGLGE